MVVRLREKGDLAGPTERAETVEDVGGREPRLLDERTGDGQAEPELRSGFDQAEEPVQRGSVGTLGDPLEDREIAVDIEVRPTRAEVEVAEPREPPGLVQMQIEDDLQIRIPSARIASR